jgi:hypothetical protein
MVNQIHSHYPPKRLAIAECGCPNPSMDEPSWAQVTSPHTHTAPDGTIVKCFHECKNTLTSLSFWVLTTLAFPLEHGIWEKLLPLLKHAVVFVLLAIVKWLGL